MLGALSNGNIVFMWFSKMDVLLIALLASRLDHCVDRREAYAPSQGPSSDLLRRKK